MKRETHGFRLPLLGAWLAVALGILVALPTAVQSSQTLPGTEGGEWRYIGGNAGHTRSSPLNQINASNFDNLEVEWIWRGDSFGQLMTRPTPIHVDGVLYTVAGNRRNVVAIDAGTGAIIWSFREPDTFRWEHSMRANNGKGVAYAELDGRGVIFITSPARFVWALDAKTGRPLENWGRPVAIEGFPQTGVVDALEDQARGWGPWENLNRPWDAYQGIPLEIGYATASSPPIVVNGVVIVGTSHENGQNQTRIENIPGDIVAYDARTGEYLWKFHVIPRPGEFGHETWESDAWTFSGNIGSWAPMSADPERGIVYIPTKGGTIDYSAGYRPGDLLFGTSVIALDVQTGERVWHFQFVHHDIWNYDTPTAPVLMDVTVEGQRIPGLFQPTKQSWLYAFNRETGEPIWPIEERQVPPTEIPGDWLSPTQPFPTKPAPYDMHGITEDDLIDYTPELRQEALEIVADYRLGPIFNPPMHRDNPQGLIGSIWCPGELGGTNIGGPAAADPQTGIIYVVSRTNCGQRTAGPGEEVDGTWTSWQPTGRTIADYALWMGTSAGLTGPQGLPLTKPPYSRITAIDLKTGEHLWWIPNGGTPRFIQDHPALRGLDIPPTGNLTHSAMLVMPTMLLHTAIGDDGTTPFLYAVDKATGERLGGLEMPGLGMHGMMSYMHQGRQRIIVPVPGAVVALSLPSAPPIPGRGNSPD